MIKKIFFILLFFFILLLILINYSKINSFFGFHIIEDKTYNNLNLEKKLIKCNLINEKIDRKNLDNERQCYYGCSEVDQVRVDTSIEFPCQPFILEER